MSFWEKGTLIVATDTHTFPVFPQAPKEPDHNRWILEGKYYLVLRDHEPIWESYVSVELLELDTQMCFVYSAAKHAAYIYFKVVG